jgi:hypothetical protein
MPKSEKTQAETQHATRGPMPTDRHDKPTTETAQPTGEPMTAKTTANDDHRPNGAAIVAKDPHLRARRLRARAARLFGRAVVAYAGARALKGGALGIG